MANHAIGSYWRRWDLHVHTPASYVQNYGSDEAAWERFLSELEALPKELAAIGINDYLFIDGYRRVLREKVAGRLPNIETIFPVIELRLSKLAGTKKLQRINYHIIFSDELDPDVIESQFLVQLSGKVVLSPDAESKGVTWQGYISRESIEKLGAKIRSTAPSGEQSKYTETDFQLGMNNINFDDNSLRELLESGWGISGNYMTAVGKTEWDQYRWNDHSIAEKKNIINSVDAVFTAAQDVTAFHRAREKLISEGVNSKLLDCSDAHQFMNSDNKDRIGNCFLWLKADPTFRGLKVALQDYDNRVFVGNEPPVFRRMRKHPRHFISSVTFEREPVSGSDETWFEGQHLTLNPELVAIIGNRGNGKSALLDSIAFAAHSDYRVDDTSFLKKFRSSKDGKAADFKVGIEWEGGAPSWVCLADDENDSLQPMVKHLPQHFIDQLCNERSDDFTQELERAIYSHVPEHELLGSSSLRDLVKKRAHGSEVTIEKLRGDLSRINAKIAHLEEQSHPHHVDSLQNRIASMKEEVKGLFQKRQPYPVKPTHDGMDNGEELAELRGKCAELEQKISGLKTRLNEVCKSIEAVQRLRSNARRVKQRVDDIMTDCKEDLELLSIHFSDIVKVEFDYSILDELDSKLAAERTSLDSVLDDEDSELLSGHREAATALDTYTEEMTEAQRRYEEAVQARSKLREQIRNMIGGTTESDSIRCLGAELIYVRDSLPSELDAQRRKRLEIAQQLFAEYEKTLAIYEELYGPVQAFVDKHEGSEAKLDVAFEATLEVEDFVDRFLGFIAQNRKGTFYGKDQGRERLSKRLFNVDFGSWLSVEGFLLDLTSWLLIDQREGFEGEQRHIHDQLKGDDVQAFYDFVFSFDYLKPQYHITMNNQTLDELSPGEKGALLLVFYLLVDNSCVPLLIDQPEENLDNQSIYTVLCPFIRQARSRRQVILVTHNPNIAVVAGADQVIYSSIDKSAGFSVSYETGALENPLIRQRIVDVLEGTMPAFEQRERKYALTDSAT